MKIPISFKDTEDELKIYNYIKSKRNYSAYIKDLVEEDMKNKNGSTKPKEQIRNNVNMEIDF